MGSFPCRLALLLALLEPGCGPRSDGPTAPSAVDPQPIGRPKVKTYDTRGQPVQVREKDVLAP